MNLLLWGIQIILAIKLVNTAWTHGPGRSRPTMQAAIQKLGGSAPLLLSLDAAVCLLGAVGLTLPPLLGIPGRVTPVVAAALCILLLLSLAFHLRTREKPMIFVSIVLAAMAAFAAYGRCALAPFEAVILLRL